MPLYIFYLCQPSGDACSFETFDLDDDVAAYEEAGVMLDQHRSAAHVAVWCGERKVCTVPRDSGPGSGTIASGHHPIRAH
jgi:hypothetical protein